MSLVRSITDQPLHTPIVTGASLPRTRSPSRLWSQAVAVTTLLLVGHTLGIGYLESREDRARVGGAYIAALESHEAYATIEWDEFVYVPRAIAVAEGWWPIDPWIHHETSMPTWGIIPPLPAVLFGALIRALNDVHAALYVATLLTTVGLGVFVIGFLRSAPLNLSFASAILSAVVFVKMPWMGVKAQQMLSWETFVRETLNPFLVGRPLDGLTTIEAGLFTYLPYTVFIVAFWRAAYRRTLRAYLIAGATAGVLVYVYYYHYIYAFALMSCWIVAAAAVRDWRDVRLGAHALGMGLACAIPHFANLLRLSSLIDLPAYVGRLGIEPGRFGFANLKYVAALAIPLLVGAAYVRVISERKVESLTLRMLGAMVLAYVGVLNLRVVLGFDVQSDHYWRQSLGLPATIWVIVALVTILRGSVPCYRLQSVARVLKLTLALLVLFGVVTSNGLWLVAAGRPSVPSPAQLALEEQIRLVQRLASPGDVLLTTDVVLTYHAAVNARVRPFVPFVHALVGEQDILTRFFTAQYFTGLEPQRMPIRTNLPTLDETAALRSEQKYLLGTDEPQPANHMSDIAQAVAAAFQRGEIPVKSRLDLILVPMAQRLLAHKRIIEHFDIVEEQSGGGYWAARVKLKVNPT
ncbi:MAG TPA: hypothetical protein VJM31_14435 [Vicinamibacterales bacterium]|nr:hypothetical protein [Vicinamibacterales bacterium]